MKKTIAIITLILLVTACGTKQINAEIPYTDEILDGIFDIKLGMSESELRAVVDTTLLKEEDRFYMIKLHPALEGREKTLILKYYVVAYDYSIEDIKLSFFDDKLHEITIRKKDLRTEKLLSSKYGMTWLDADKTTCTEDGRKVTTTTIRCVWRTNSSNIGCSLYSSSSQYSDYSTYLLRIVDFFDFSQIMKDAEHEYDKRKKLEAAQKERESRGGEEKTMEELMEKL